MKTVYDTQAQEHVTINAPQYAADSMIERYRKEKAIKEDFNMTLFQFLTDPEREDMNPDNIHTFKANEATKL